MDRLGIQPSSTKVERRLVEKNRRNQMKILFNKLNSLLPSYNPKVLNLPSFVFLPTFFLHGDFDSSINYVYMGGYGLQNLNTKLHTV